MMNSSSNQNTIAASPLPSQQFLNSPLKPPSSTKRINSLLSKVYKQASELYLTRRLPECLAMLEPSVFPYRSVDENSKEDENLEVAMIATASRSLRVKLWNLYLTLLNDIVDLGASEGRSTIGNRKWKELVTVVQNGEIWNQVVKIGYGGVEANVDADVVVNLSTLLLTQCDTQELNQERLETYLAGSNSFYGNNSQEVDSFVPDSSVYGSHLEADKSTQNLRDLNSRIKILEIYALHVLPRTDQWHYAREIITISDILDAETKESFLQILDGLKKEGQEKDPTKDPTNSPTIEKMYQEDFMDERLELNERAPGLERKSFNESRRNVEKDYGIEEISKFPPADRIVDITPVEPPLGRSKSVPSSRAFAVLKNRVPSRVIACGNAMIATMQHIMFTVSTSFSKRPIFFVRFILFLLGLIIALSRHSMREQLKPLLGKGWRKLRETAGMGVKVSYM